MEVEIRIEPLSTLDPVRTAEIARLAFGRARPELSPERFAWTYREGFPDAALIAAYLDGRKIGQLAGVFKTLRIDGSSQLATELVDLFVAPEFRSFQVVSNLYRELRKSLQMAGAKLIYAYANEAASVLNKRFFRMDETTQLPARAGFSMGLPLSGARIALLEDIHAIAALCERHAEQGRRGGIAWSGEAFRRRISSPIYRYVCATDGQAALLASPRVIRSVPVLLVVGSFALEEHAIDPRSVSRLLSRLCAATRRPLFLYVGWNDSVPFPSGHDVPPSFLGGKFLMQSNFLNSHRASLSRFELLDVDYG